ncbi:MAG: hypothetical protein FVQ80_11975 [Planctomycetes bacterium]|nr:hypothetical protein [Planctomycetota bacterium]
MAENYKKVPKTEIGEMVIVTFVEDLEQAKEYEALLKNNDIPAMVKEQESESESSSEIAILVPEDYLDEAHVVIESQDAYDDFYDFSVDDDADEMFDEDIFDDEF